MTIESTTTIEMSTTTIEMYYYYWNDMNDWNDWEYYYYWHESKSTIEMTVESTFQNVCLIRI